MDYCKFYEKERERERERPTVGKKEGGQGIEEREEGEAWRRCGSLQGIFSRAKR
jgi:hypothetical protein